MDPISDITIGGVLAAVGSAIADSIPSLGLTSGLSSQAVSAAIGPEATESIVNLVSDVGPSVVDDLSNDQAVMDIYNSISNPEELSNLSEEEISSHINKIAEGLQKNGLATAKNDNVVKKVVGTIMEHKDKFYKAGAAVAGSAPIVHFFHRLKKKYDRGFKADKRVLKRSGQKDSKPIQEIKRYFF